VDGQQRVTTLHLLLILIHSLLVDRDAGGEPFTSLSSAAAYAKGRKSANGWEFWEHQTRRERRPLKELRDELIRGER
jgi:hypothetical protein